MRVPGWALLSLCIGCQTANQADTTPPPEPRTEAVRRPKVTAGRRRDLAQCHEDDAAPGTATYVLTITEAGAVSRVRVTESTVPAVTLNCSQQQMRRWAFPAGQHGTLAFTMQYRSGPTRPTYKDMIRHRTSALQHCYNIALREDSTLSGKVTFDVTIDESGQVVDVQLETQPPFPSSLRTCLHKMVLGWRFPPSWEPAFVSFSVILGEA